MKIVINRSYEEMSKQASKDLIQLAQAPGPILFCPASGDSPLGLYRELVNYYKERQPDISQWCFVSLDEWVGMNETSEGSCRDHLNKQLFQPLQLKHAQICFFDGKAKDLELECLRIECFIEERGGIHACVLGLGMNGHVGLNEPGTPVCLRSHVSVINEATEKIAQKYFSKDRQLSQGITLGLATIMQSRHLFLLVAGKHKAAIVKSLLQSAP